MCLAIPVKIVEIKNKIGIGEVGGVKRKVNLLLLDEVKVGDYVLLHAGFAISKVKKEEAEELLEMLASLEM
ncbi:MAG: HypC/HybG/HupF family hydrogenase formation chaperone [bacterium]